MIWLFFFTLNDKCNKRQTRYRTTQLDWGSPSTEGRARWSGPKHRTTHQSQPNARRWRRKTALTISATFWRNQGGADAVVRTRIGKARVAFHQLKNIWGSSAIGITTKIRFFNTS
ncbi:hypothetical protein DPMN_189730 [Dreissena polymorpha]|uniref:DUF6451 domain-containing protein n=1 Tax=Dreissena polymorpha TaxID=45954 RepID=A0A9D4ICM6_DREPO|nr:hypothetical protein DPMN_189730 [Dreissena polymorpha]